jgi:hypothetical protein
MSWPVRRLARLLVNQITGKRANRLTGEPTHKLEARLHQKGSTFSREYSSYAALDFCVIANCRLGEAANGKAWSFDAGESRLSQARQKITLNFMERSVC